MDQFEHRMQNAYLQESRECIGYTKLNRRLRVEGHIARMGDAFGTYALLIDHLNNTTGECFPTIDKLAEESGASRPTIIRRLKQLEALGYIKVIRAGSSKRNKHGQIKKDANRYIILPLNHINAKLRGDEVLESISQPQPASEAVVTTNEKQGISQNAKHKWLSRDAVAKITAEVKDVIKILGLDEKSTYCLDIIDNILFALNDPKSEYTLGIAEKAASDINKYHEDKYMWPSDGWASDFILKHLQGSTTNENQAPIIATASQAAAIESETQIELIGPVEKDIPHVECAEQPENIEMKVAEPVTTIKQPPKRKQMTAEEKIDLEIYYSQSNLNKNMLNDIKSVACECVDKYGDYKTGLVAKLKSSYYGKIRYSDSIDHDAIDKICDAYYAS